MMRNKSLSRVLVASALLVALLLAGCRSSKSLKEPSSTDFLSCKVSLTVPSGQAVFQVDGTLKAHRGQIIQISLLMPLLRTEVGRLELTPSDALILDRMNRRFCYLSHSQMARQVPIGTLFGQLDEMLFARARKGEDVVITPSQIGLPGLTKGKVVLTDFTFEKELEVSPTSFTRSRYQEVRAEELLKLILSL